MPMKLEKVKVGYPHAVDSQDKSMKPISRPIAATPNSSLTETINGLGNPGRLNLQYSVGKNPTTKNIQGLK
jgi:hypothetical protein